MFKVANNTAIINGQSGKYDEKIENYSIRYGRNAMDNYYDYVRNYEKAHMPSIDLSNLSNLSKDEFVRKLDEVDKQIEDLKKNYTPIHFQYQYMPDGTTSKNMDKMALLASAYEELDRNYEIPTKNITHFLQNAFGEKVSACALDLDKNGKVDVSEYAASILATDALSNNPNELRARNIDGKINNKGQNASFAYYKDENYGKATHIFTAFYRHYELEDAQKEFKKLNIEA